MEKITCEEDYEDAWVCICGNKPTDYGFYPCNASGNQVEPTRKEWDGLSYVCDDCGRIINQETLEVIGYKKH